MSILWYSFQSHKAYDIQNNLQSSRERNLVEFYSDMAKEVDSDEEYVGPVEKPKNIEWRVYCSTQEELE